MTAPGYTSRRSGWCRTHAASCAVLGLCLVWASVAGAVENDNQIKRFAIIVAHNGSDSPQLEPLHYADDDGVQYLRLLERSARVQLLTVLDDESQRRHGRLAPRTRLPTLSELRTVLAETYRDIGRARQQGVRTELLLVFVGHGSVDDEGKGFVYLTDGHWTRADLFHDVIAASPADMTHIIIDACQAYSLVAGRGEHNGAASQPTGQLGFERFLQGNDLAGYPSVGVLFANTESRETHEWSRIRAGIFSHQVRSALSGAADVNGDGLIEYSEVAAFVDAANAELARQDRGVTTFAWPPARDRRAPLADLRGQRDMRLVVLEPSLTGRLWLESERGDVWAELHKAADQRAVIAVPAELDFFLRDARHELEIPRGTQRHVVREAPTRAYAVAHRGAVDRAFEQGLFAIPFDGSYYQGYVSGHRHLVPVSRATDPLIVDDSVERSRQAGWTLGGAYVSGFSLLVPEALDHGAQLRLGWPLWRGLYASGTIEGGLTALQRASAWRVVVAPGLSYRFDLLDNFSVHTGGELGYAIVGVTGVKPSGDNTVLMGRLSVDAGVRLFDHLWLRAGPAVSGYLLTLDRSEAVLWRPELLVSIGYEGPRL